MVLCLKARESRPPPGLPVHPQLTASPAGWSSPVARQAHNLKVTGSNPVPATKIFRSSKALPTPCCQNTVSTKPVEALWKQKGAKSRVVPRRHFQFEAADKGPLATRQCPGAAGCAPVSKSLSRRSRAPSSLPGSDCEPFILLGHADFLFAATRRAAASAMSRPRDKLVGFVEQRLRRAPEGEVDPAPCQTSASRGASKTCCLSPLSPGAACHGQSFLSIWKYGID